MYREKVLRYLNAEIKEEGTVFQLNGLKGQIIYSKHMRGNIQIATFLLKETLEKSQLKRLKSELGFQVIVFDTFIKSNLIGLIVNERNIKSLNRLKDLSNYLVNNQIKLQEDNVLGLNEVDGYIDYQVNLQSAIYLGLKVPVNLEDYQKRQDEIKKEEVRKEGNLSQAITMAIVGALIGAIPAFLAMILFSLMSFWLYMIIPVISILLYKKANGPSKTLIVGLIAFLTVFLSIGILVLGYNLTAFANDLTLNQMLEIEGMMGAFIGDIIFALVGGVAAIWFSWTKLTFKPKSI